MKILVIEDERDIRQLVSYALKSEGHDVTEAGTVDDAENKVLKEDWDLVVSDVMLPHLGGFEIVELVKARGNNTPVILLTGLDKDILHSTLTDADLIITKPVSRKKLIDSVNQIAAAKTV